jgi:hypothetical protein
MPKPGTVSLVGYREELEAAQARADALEQELADTKGQLEQEQSKALVLRSDTSLAQVDAGSPAARRWLGAPTRIETKRTLEGEIPEEAHTDLIETIRQRLGQVGGTTVLPGSLAWAADTHKNGIGPNINVYITVRNGKTEIRADERMGQLAGAIYGGVGGGVGGGGIALPLMAAAINPLLLLVSLPIWLGGSYAGCRYLYKRSVRRRTRRLEELMEELVGVAKGYL